MLPFLVCAPPRPFSPLFRGCVLTAMCARLVGGSSGREVLDISFLIASEPLTHDPTRPAEFVFELLADLSQAPAGFD